MVLQTIDTKRYIKLLGRGFVFPMLNGFELIDGEKKVFQDLEQGLMTTPGERVRNPQIGGGLNSLVWENIGKADNKGRIQIRRTVNADPRCSCVNIVSRKYRELDLIVFIVTVKILKTNSTYNWVVTAQPSARIDR